MTADEYETREMSRAYKPPGKRGDYQPTEREIFWLLVGCVAAAGVSVGVAVQNLAMSLAEVLK